MTAEPIDKAIDPARPGLSKSLMSSPCERKAWFGETVRDDKNRRLRFPMPERVLMGSAIDSAHSYIAWHLREGRPWSRDGAVREGLKRARSDEQSWALLTDDDEEIFHRQLDNAIHLFMRDGALEQFMGVVAGIRIQGNEGESLTWEDVVGTPDYILADGSILDVKASGSSEGRGRTYTPEKFDQAAEMPVYALLMHELSGHPPPRLIYQVYVRQVKPHWQWIEVPGEMRHVDLGRIHVKRWRKGMAAGDPDLFAFNPQMCKDCPFANPIPDVGFEGCPVGLLQPKEAAA
jgi:hypothetical protein